MLIDHTLRCHNQSPEAVAQRLLGLASSSNIRRPSKSYTTNFAAVAACADKRIKLKAHDLTTVPWELLESRNEDILLFDLSDNDIEVLAAHLFSYYPSLQAWRSNGGGGGNALPHMNR